MRVPRVERTEEEDDDVIVDAENQTFPLTDTENLAKFSDDGNAHIDSLQVGFSLTGKKGRERSSPAQFT